MHWDSVIHPDLEYHYYRDVILNDVIQILEIPLTDAEKVRLLNHLDRDGDGEIDYRLTICVLLIDYRLINLYY